MDDKKIEIIRKLLAKAENPGVTDEERETLNAKAHELMIKYQIDEAVARAAQDEPRMEPIIVKSFVADVPKSYSHEYARLGYQIAEVLGGRAFLFSATNGKTGVKVAGFTSDLEMIAELYASLTRQCTFALGPWFRAWTNANPFANGSDRWNAKRGFITGFADAVGDRLKAIHVKLVEEAGESTAIALRDRGKLVRDWVDAEFTLSNGRGRKYGLGTGAGFAAGQRADVGQSSVSRSVPRRNAIGG